MERAPASARSGHGNGAESAVVDIGSNTVRLVVYGAPRRAPTVLLNEKVVARLGRDLEDTGAIPEEAMEIALPALRRYAMILDNLAPKRIDIVATAAVREASNGEEFIRRASEAGLKPRVLSGEDEARVSAFGVIGAFPDAHGVVCDLGGGSLELVSVQDGDSHGGQSLPLGTLRLPSLRANGDAAFRERLEQIFADAGWATAHEGPLYMVGGTWRALATYAMRAIDHPLTDPHGLSVPTRLAQRFASEVAHMSPDDLSNVDGVSSSRVDAMPHASAMLEVMIEKLKPDSLIFSSWGLREGLIYSALEPLAQGQDPLQSAIAHFAGARGTDPAMAARVAAWCVAAAGDMEAGEERLRIAATMLGLANAWVEPNWRASHALDWALNKRWIGLDMAGRGQLAAALWATCGNTDLPAGIDRLADEAALHRAIGWGLAIRLHRRLGGGTGLALQSTSLVREGERLLLSVGAEESHLIGHHAQKDLDNLADWLGLQPEVQISVEVD